MKRVLAIFLALIPASGLAAEVLDAMSGPTSEESSETSVDATTQSEKVQIAHAVKRDAEGYLAGSEMTRALRLTIERLQAEHPELGTDCLAVSSTHRTG